MATFTTNHGETIYYLDENPYSSQVMVLLHGLGVHSGSWLLQLPIFKQAGYRIIVPDLPGFGQSRNARFKSINQVSSIIFDLLQFLKIDRATVLGISMGGIIALQLTLAHSEQVQSLILVNTTAKLNIGNPILLPYYLWRFFLIQTKGQKEQAVFVANRLFPQPENSLFRQAVIQAIMQADFQSYRSAMISIARFDVRSRLPDIRCPTLVVTSEKDTTIPARHQKPLAARIPNARHVFIRNAGHAVIIDQPESFNSCVLEFLGNQPISENQSVQVIN